MSTPTILSAINQIRSLLTRKEKLQWGGMVGCAIVSSIMEVTTASLIVILAQALTQPEFAKSYLSKVSFMRNIDSNHALMYIAITCVAAYTIKNTIVAFEVFYQNFIIQKMNFNFKNKFLNKYIGMSYKKYLTRNSSEGFAIVGGDIERFFSIGVLALINIFSEAVIFAFLISMVIVMNPYLALIVFFIGGGLAFIISKIMLPFFYKLGHKYQNAALLSNQYLLQFFHAFKEIVLLGKQHIFIEKYQEQSIHTTRVLAIQISMNALPRLVIEILFVSMFVIAISYMLFEHDSPQRMIGILGGYIYVGFRLMPGLNRIIGQMNNFKAVIPSITKVSEEYLSLNEEEHYSSIPEFSFQNEILIKKLYFKYINADTQALKNINLIIQKGEKIGITGETGSGKSTLLDLILGLLKPDKGDILIDNKYPVHCSQWHKIIGYVPQSIYLIDDTIESNITFGEKKIDKYSLEKAIDDSQLHKLIEKLPMGTKTIVGERGMRLSGGEKQRISIARALYRNPQILIFDEATSALDNDTEYALMQTIESLSKDKTIIMIAHRISTLKDCDRIVVMREGEIEKITNYSDLSSRSGNSNYENIGAL